MAPAAGDDLTVQTQPRIAVYMPALVGGGAERAGAVLASGFHARGCEVRLFVDFAAEANRPFVDSAVPVVELSRSHAGSVRALAGHLSKRCADVVLAVGGAANVKAMLAKVLARSPMPIVLSYHGRGDIGYGRLGGWAFTFARVLTRRAAHTVCVSESLKRHLVDDHRAFAARISCIPNAIAVDDAIPADDEAALLARPLAVVTLGRLAPEKDFATLIQAVARLPPDVTLTIHGEGPERDDLLALAGRLGLGGRVGCPGYAPTPWPLYAAARVFALTSKSEGFGNVVVEALAAGLPVVATDCGGPREILDDGRYGTLVPVGDIGAVARGLADALARPGDPAPRRSRAACYATDRVVQDYLALFERIIDQASGHGQPRSRPG